MFKRVLLLVALLVGVLVVTGLMVGQSNPISVEPVSAYSFVEPSVPSSENFPDVPVWVPASELAGGRDHVDDHARLHVQLSRCRCDVFAKA